MENWKQKIDERERKLQAEEDARKAKIEEERQRVEAKKKADEAAAYALKLRDHQTRFRCHIANCSNTSSGPGMERYQYSTNSFHSDNDDGMRWGWRESWDIPTHISFCSICKKPTCADHIYKGICMTCADKV